MAQTYYDTAKAYKYIMYDPDFETTKITYEQFMTVKEFKTLEGYTTGVWSPYGPNGLKKTYQAYIAERRTEKNGFKTISWKELNEMDIIDFSLCPNLKVVLISVF